MPPTGRGTCRFPGCLEHVAERAAGAPGRSPEYCSDPAHTRATAFRARREAARVADPDGIESSTGASVAARVGVLVTRFETAVERVERAAARVVAELRVLDELAAVTTTGGQDPAPGTPAEAELAALRAQVHALSQRLEREVPGREPPAPPAAPEPGPDERVRHP